MGIFKSCFAVLGKQNQKKFSHTENQSHVYWVGETEEQRGLVCVLSPESFSSAGMVSGWHHHLDVQACISRREWRSPQVCTSFTYFFPVRLGYVLMGLYALCQYWIDLEVLVLHKGIRIWEPSLKGLLHLVHH